MENRHDGTQLILALYPMARGFGFALFEGRHRPIDWGVKDARGDDKNRAALAKAAELIAWHEPDLILLEHPEGSRRAERIRKLHWALVRLANDRKIAVRQLQRSDVRAAFANVQPPTKYRIAQAIARD